MAPRYNPAVQQTPDEQVGPMKSGPKPNIYGNRAKSYHVIVFSEKEAGSPAEDSPWVAVNGETYRFKRGVPVAVPDYIAGALEEGSQPVWDFSDPLNPTQTGWQMHYPFNYQGGEINEEVYLKLKAIQKVRDLTAEELQNVAGIRWTPPSRVQARRLTS